MFSHGSECLKEPDVEKIENAEVEGFIADTEAGICIYLALWLLQCHKEHLKFRYINITLQALEQSTYSRDGMTTLTIS